MVAAVLYIIPFNLSIIFSLSFSLLITGLVSSISFILLCISSELTVLIYPWFSRLLISRRLHPDAKATALDRLSGADLGGLAALGLAIDAHLAGGDHALADSSARRDARELQQLAKLDVLLIQYELDGFHWFDGNAYWPAKAGMQCGVFDQYQAMRSSAGLTCETV